MISENRLQVKRDYGTPTKAWDRLADLARLGDSSGNNYKIFCGPNRVVSYEAVETTPTRYYKEGGIYAAMSAQAESKQNPWLVRPAMVRDLSWPIKRVLYDQFYEQSNDIYMETVEMGQESGFTWRTERFDEAELLNRQREYERWLSKQVRE